MINKDRLFYGSCFALITTALSFSISAGTLESLGKDLSYTAEQLGIIGSTWFYGFPISMIIGGLVYNTVGPKRIMQIAFLCHLLGVILSLYAIYNISDSSYSILIFSNLLMGFGCGCTEAACNPMIADMFSGLEMNRMLNRFHMWFPGGIVIGSLISEVMKYSEISWKAQYWVIIIPAFIYVYLFYNQSFPKPKSVETSSLSSNLKALATPLFIFMFCCMALTAISEFGPQKWTGLIMSKSGASPMLILALVTGLMAVARFFAAPVVSALGQTGVLWGGSILAAIGIYLFSTVTGSMVYVAAIFFAMGVAYFWPNMVGFVAQNIPLSGALGMSIIGGVGMFSTAIFQPFIGRWIDEARAEETSKGLVGNAMELAAGQDTLRTMVLFPCILILLFGVLYFWMRGRKTTTATATAAH